MDATCSAREQRSPWETGTMSQFASFVFHLGLLVLAHLIAMFIAHRMEQWWASLDLKRWWRRG